MAPGTFRGARGAAAAFGGSDVMSAVSVVPHGSVVPGVSVDVFEVGWVGWLNPSAVPSALAGAETFVSFSASPLVVRTIAVVECFPES